MRWARTGRLRCVWLSWRPRAFERRQTIALERCPDAPACELRIAAVSPAMGVVPGGLARDHRSVELIASRVEASESMRTVCVEGF